MIGQTISHYRILEELGRGGMAIVYKAEDTRLGRPVALKFPLDHLAGDEGFVKRFTQESRAAAALNHPNVCTIYDVGTFGTLPFITMEYLHGQTLNLSYLVEK